MNIEEIVNKHIKWLNDEEGGERANLRWADLRWADLSWADLTRADLSWADLTRVSLYGANLRWADLRWADLRWADLSQADLSHANLSQANLTGAKITFQICPQHGSFMAYKKLKNNCIAKVRIPAYAARTTVIGSRMCRAGALEVLSITDDMGRSFSECPGKYDRSIIYRVGEVVWPDAWDGDPRVECTNGLHFWMTKEEAESW